MKSDKNKEGGSTSWKEHLDSVFSKEAKDEVDDSSKEYELEEFEQREDSRY